MLGCAPVSSLCIPVSHLPAHTHTAMCTHTHTCTLTCSLTRVSCSDRGCYCLVAGVTEVFARVLLQSGDEPLVPGSELSFTFVISLNPLPPCEDHRSHFSDENTKAQQKARGRPPSSSHSGALYLASWRRETPLSLPASVPLFPVATWPVIFQPWCQQLEHPQWAGEGEVPVRGIDRSRRGVTEKGGPRCSRPQPELCREKALSW